jgi:hypothetical protein
MVFKLTVTTKMGLQQGQAEENTGMSSKWKIKVNETKSIQTTFTLRKGRCPTVQINHTNIQQTDQARYLGLTCDSKLNWKPHIVKKRKQMDQKN